MNLVWLCIVVGAASLSVDEALRSLVASMDFSVLDKNGALLAPLLEPRPPASAGLENVRRFVQNDLANLSFGVSFDAFTADTPIGGIPMANLIAKRPVSKVWSDEAEALVGQLDGSNPPVGTLLSAHYDSKIEPKGFVGAIDSSVPCALMLFAAHTLANAGIPFPADLVFFDGEEAIAEWTDADSLYGARHYAETFDMPPALVLLDLIGARDQPEFPSWFPETYSWHRSLYKLNQRLLRLGLVKKNLVFSGYQYHQYAGAMLDDHIPFWKAGVPCLHFIPPRFPDTWHTIDDDADHLDPAAVKDWAVLITSWLAMWSQPDQPLNIKAEL